MIKLQEIEIQSNDSNESMSYEFLTPKIYQQLLKCHELATEFVQELADLKNIPLPESLASYTKDRKLQQKSAEEILELMEARLNKMIKNNKVKKNWSQDDISILLWFIGKYMQKNHILSHQQMTKYDWAVISSMIAGSSSHNCMFKFISLKKFKLEFHKWEKEEQNLLLQVINQQNGDYNWKNIAQKLYEKNNKKKIFRTAKQCREHWSCYLDPSIRKGPWDKEQDKKLIKMVHFNKCVKKWSVIKKDFLGRTQNALKNRYNLLLQKKRKRSGDKHLSQQQLINSILQSLIDEKQETKSQNQRKDTQVEPLIQKIIVLEVQTQKEIVAEEQKNIQKPIFIEKQQIELKNVQKQVSIINVNGSSPLIPLIPEQKRSELVTYNQGYNYIYFNFTPYPQNLDPSNIQQMAINNWFFKFSNQ